MTNTEVEEFIAAWWGTNGKVFRYVREFMFDEYLLIRKEPYHPLYTVDATSTYRLPDMTKEEFADKLRRGELVYSSDPKFGVDCRTMKTGGCECAAWTNPGSKHSDWCKLRYLNR